MERMKRSPNTVRIKARRQGVCSASFVLQPRVLQGLGCLVRPKEERRNAGAAEAQKRPSTHH